MQIAFLGGSRDFLAPRCSRDIAASRRKRLEDRIEMVYDLGFPADHLAVTTLQPPYTAARANIYVVHTLCGEFFRTTDVIDVVGVAAIDHDVTGFKLSSEILKRRIDDGRRHHQPHGAWFFQLLHQFIERGRGSCTVAR